MKPSFLKIFAGFFLLFACYHTAGYMMLFCNSSAGFLFYSVLFFPLAFFIARWQGDKGLDRWGLSFKKGFPAFFLTGLLAGLAISSLMTLTCLALQIEVISFLPPLNQFLSQAALLIFGCSLSSLTEDLLTRSYLFRHTRGKWQPAVIVLFSALVYALNHIHRLHQPVYFLYVVVLGVQLAIPLLLTKNIWYTFGVHWAGNIVYHLTNSVMHTTDGSHPLPGIVVALFFSLLAIPVHYYVCRQLTGNQTAKTPRSLSGHSSVRIRHSSGLV